MKVAAPSAYPYTKGFIEPQPWPFDGCKRREPVLDTDHAPPRVVRRVGWHRCLRCGQPFWSEDVTRLRLCARKTSDGAATARTAVGPAADRAGWFMGKLRRRRPFGGAVRGFRAARAEVKVTGPRNEHRDQQRGCHPFALTLPAPRISWCGALFVSGTKR